MEHKKSTQMKHLEHEDLPHISYYPISAPTRTALYLIFRCGYSEELVNVDWRTFTFPDDVDDDDDDKGVLVVGKRQNREN